MGRNIVSALGDPKEHSECGESIAAAAGLWLGIRDVSCFDFMLLQIAELSVAVPVRDR